MSKPEDGDVPFDDQPVHRDPKVQEGATEERTSPSPDSTGPTTIREDLGTLAEEGRKLWEAVETRIVAPMIRSYPDVARHLGTAGREVIAAYRTALRNQEQVWREQHPEHGQEKITVERVDPADPADGEEHRHP